jgi:hypothetical protein
MKTQRFFLATALVLGLAAGFFSVNSLQAQDAPRPAVRGTAFSLGVNCPAGQAVSVSPTTGVPICVNSIDNASNATNAVNAQNATTAQSATTATVATTANNLDANARVSASQLNGSLSASQLQGAMPTCATGQVLTNVGGTFSCVAAGSSGSSVMCLGGTLSYSQTYVGWMSYDGGHYPASLSAQVPSMSAGTNRVFTLTGGFPNDEHNRGGSCRTTVACSADDGDSFGRISFTNCVGSVGRWEYVWAINAPPTFTPY